MGNNIVFLVSISFLTFACAGGKTEPEQNTNRTSEPNQRNKMDTVGLNYIMGKFEPETHPLFEEISLDYADRKGMYLRSEALDAFKKMYQKADSAGMKLVIRSATRTFQYQKGIWERKWRGAVTLSDGTNLADAELKAEEKALKILEYSAMPGTSRHHWGTDIDMNSFENEYFESGKGKRIYEWLTAHAPSFGFVQVYTPKNVDRPHGYNEEKWHWSYKPLSSQFMNEAKQIMKNHHISGFEGADTATKLDVVNTYVLGVSPDCF